MSAHPILPVQPEEYLAIDRCAEVRSEYYNGRVYAMSGGSFAHSLIGPNLMGELRNALKETDCRVVSDLRLRVAPNGLYTYPDAMVVCGDPSFADDYRDTLLNPILIVEVLSKSTEAHDRGFKFGQYRTVGSLREYVLVSQYEPRVEVFRRQSDGEFKLSESVGRDAICHFVSLGCEVPLFEIYRGIAFPVEDII